ncbi:surface lipoprotein assembly modifier [Sphingomonas corticis]|jgi:hypothetical protein|uniref:DUF560 domain-containing protein n=1 Tax=Sphingomonas corticis TaxID=2722791 RepID=A0ABX1CVJ8_9SPHN|nr:surface lipoprotein assembly modifier [Sphingomonas corticis]NJR79922.1 DUF560 domain-containing protein [Sphingomonas corticis]
MTRPLAALLAPVMVAAAASAAGAARADTLIDRCQASVCRARLSPQQLLGEVQELVLQARYAEARPLLAALSQAPGVRLEYRFLSGYVAQKTNDLKTAAAFYRAILTDDPNQTRVRLELARVMLLQGKRQGADRQFRLAEQDADLPPEIARTIRATRDVIRSQRDWSLNVDAGIMPDSNINNATSADNINVYLGGQAVPLALDDSARPRSGVGRFGSVDAGLRLPAFGESMMLVDLDAVGTDYDGRDFDDLAIEAAVGPELPVGERLRVRAQAVGAQRMFGGRVAMRQAGIKGGVETMLSRVGRLGVQFDARRTFQAFDPGYTGWQWGGYATYEHAVAKAIVASGGIFARRDALTSAAFSSTEGGVIAGIGGELPLGLNVAVSGTASRAVYDAPLYFFSAAARRDWRFTARATLGVRAWRIAGLSPSINASVSRIDSTLDYYAATRMRYRFTLARYF